MDDLRLLLMPAKFRLTYGSHTDPNGGMCIMNLVSFMNGDRRITDRPECACPVIGTFAISVNDYTSDAIRQELLPLYSRILGSRGTTEDERRRSEIFVRFAWQMARRGRLNIANAAVAAANHHVAGVYRAAAASAADAADAAAKVCVYATEHDKVWRDAIAALDVALAAGPQGVGYEAVDVHAKVRQYRELVGA